MNTTDLSKELIKQISSEKQKEPLEPQITLDDLLKEQWLRKRNSGELKWTTRNGDKIALKSMSDAHLANAIKRLIEYEENLGSSSNHKHEDAGDRV